MTKLKSNTKMPILYHITFIYKTNIHSERHRVYITFHPICTVYFIVNTRARARGYVPLDNK